jgi:hypothetical protein
MVALKYEGGDSYINMETENKNIVIVGLTFTLSTLRISSSSKDSCAADVQWMQSTGLKYRRYFSII